MYARVMVLALLLALLLGGAFLWYVHESPTPGPTACTMDAKLCPDGSSVGRVGPDCQFAPCPSE